MTELIGVSAAKKRRSLKVEPANREHRSIDLSVSIFEGGNGK